MILVFYRNTHDLEGNPKEFSDLAYEVWNARKGEHKHPHYGGFLAHLLNGPTTLGELRENMKEYFKTHFEEDQHTQIVDEDQFLTGVFLLVQMGFIYCVLEENHPPACATISWPVS